MNDFEEMESQLGSAWMQTFSGRVFWPLNPRSQDVFIEDIAHALSNICRYSGHTKTFYSVAQHSVLVSEHCPTEYRLEGLLHDAAEAYLADIVRPVKPHLAGYKDLEAGVERAIAARFNLIYPMPVEVKEIDNRILFDERDQLMREPPRPWNLHGEPLGISINPWGPYRAHASFMGLFERCVAARSART